MMDELLILLPIRIHFPFQSIGLRTLDHFMGTHFLRNYVTFHFLPSLKLPVSHVAEGRPNKLREKKKTYKQTVHHHAMESWWLLQTCMQLSASVHSPMSNREGRENIWLNKLSRFLCWEAVKTQYFFWLIAVTLRIKDLHSSSLKLSLFCDVLFFKVHKHNHTSIFLSGICYDHRVVLLDAKNTEGLKLLIIVLSEGKRKTFVWMLCWKQVLHLF